MSTALIVSTMPNISSEDMEKALATSDVSHLSAATRVHYLLALCQKLGISPLTKPFILLKNPAGEMNWYPTVGCAEQLRALHRVSIRVVSRERMGEELYCITVAASLPDGRTEESTGVVPVAGLSGKALGDALMRCESKAKRRVTFALVGLGMAPPDEPEGHPVRINYQTGEIDEPETPRLTLLDRPAEQAKSIETHTQDLYGPSTVMVEPTWKSPVSPPIDSATEGPTDALILEIASLVLDSGRDVPKYWASTCKRFRVAFARNISPENLAAIKVECETYLAQNQKKTAKAKIPTAEIAIPVWLQAWRESTLARLPHVQDIFLAEQLKDALADATLDQFRAEELTERIMTDAAADHRPAEGPDDIEEAMI